MSKIIFQEGKMLWGSIDTKAWKVATNSSDPQPQEEQVIRLKSSEKHSISIFKKLRMCQCLLQVDASEQVNRNLTSQKNC